MRTLGHGIFQGCAKKAEELSQVGACEHAGIKALLCTAWDVSIKPPPGIATMFLPVNETEQTPWSYFEAAVNFYDRFNPIFVFCQMGAHRSRVFAAALLVGSGMTLETALKLADPPPVSLPTISLKRWYKEAVVGR